ncbi:YigZ family protein [uncultured Microbacterium sp.]|uniref:IMPACT family protein n=1 Tax=uncultured Microbacterium sp. TaxID=191216 RepID=UPI0025CB79B5|nr:YigZ family protein [uncultured Microbacterium sp.]
MSSYPDTISEAVESELVVRKSRFLTIVAPARTNEEAEGVVAAQRRRHADARHHCTAMIFGVHGDRARSSDDGEPSGTAGVPMLDVLRRRAMTDVVAVVTRYFGGVKLGAGGLVRAYSTAVSAALDTATPVHRRELREALIEIPHADAGRVENALREWASTHEASVSGISYAACATLALWIPPAAHAALQAELASLSAGTLTALFGELRITDVPH